MLLNQQNKTLNIYLSDSYLDIVQDRVIFPLQELQNDFLSQQNVEKLTIDFNYCSFYPSEFIKQINEVSQLLKNFKNLTELYIKITNNQDFGILQNIDVMINEISHLPIKIFSFQHACDLLPNIDYFIKHLALNTQMQLQDIRLDIKILNNINGQDSHFNRILQNLSVIISKNQYMLRSFKLTFLLLKYESAYQLDYQLFNTLLQCRNLTRFIYVSNVIPNQYLELPPSLNNPQLLHLQNLKELNLEFESFDSTRLDLSQKLYKLCYKNITSLRLVNSIESIQFLDILNLNSQIQIFQFYISSPQHKFNIQDFNALKQLTILSNLISLKIQIIQQSSISNKENNGMLVARDLLVQLPFLLHYEIKVKGFIDSQNFIRFFNDLKNKEYLIRLQQMCTSPGLKELMQRRKQLIHMINIINKQDYKYKIKSLFRKDIIIDMLKIQIDL